MASTFGRVVRFPLILKAIPAALQPPRLLIGLVVILVLMSVGRAWDGITQPRVHSAGLTAGVLTDRSEARRKEVLKRAMQSMCRRIVIRLVMKLASGRCSMPAMSSEKFSADTAISDDAIDDEQLQRRDEQYFDTLRQINDIRPKHTFEATSAHVAAVSHTDCARRDQSRPARHSRALVICFCKCPSPSGEITSRSHLLRHYHAVDDCNRRWGGQPHGRVSRQRVNKGLRMIEAWQFAMLNWPRLVLAPLFPPLLAAIIAIVIILLGVLMMVPVLDVLGGALYGLALLLGFLVAFLILGYAVSFPMLIPAVACENCDAADAQQRAYAYVLSRPLHLLGYGITGIVGLALGYVLIAFVAATMLNFTAALFSTLTGNSAMAFAGGFGLFDLGQHIAPEIHPRWHNASAHGSSACGRRWSSPWWRRTCSLTSSPPRRSDTY
jgi:hypothetical protein